MGKKSKAKRRKFIAKISSDGKISKKEGQKAAKKGISLRKIQNRNVSAYRDAVRSYEQTPTERRSSTRPSFEPLKIKRGAERADFARQMEAYQPSKPKTSSPKPETPQNTNPGFVPEFLPTDFVDQPVSVNPIVEQGPSVEDLFSKQIAELQAGFAKSFKEQQDMFNAQMGEQRDRMTLLRQQMKEQTMAGMERPEIGVRGAQGSTGNPLAIARRGVSGSFGRAGMRISSLNI